MDERRLLSSQAPTNTLSNVRSYFQGLTGDRAVRLRERILHEQNLESLAVSEAVSSASPLRLESAPVPLVSSPELTPSASTYQNYIRDRQQKFNDKRSNHPKFLEAFRMLATFYANFDAIECATDPKVFLYPCPGDPGSKLCLKYGLRHRRLSTAVFCDNCALRKIKIRRQETLHQKVKLGDIDGKRTAADSRISFKSLSPGETKVRMANLAIDRKVYRNSTSILRQALVSSKAKFKFLDCGDSFQSLITIAFQSLSNLDAEEKAEAKLSTRRNRAKAEDWVLAEDVGPLIEHLDGMRCFHHDAIIDQDYMKNCYSEADQSRNGGWLSLLSKDFFDFGKVLLSHIRDNVQQQQWGRHGNDSIKVAAEAICTDVAVKKAFFDACSASTIPVSVLKTLMDRLVLKTFHARAGASMDAWKRKNTAREVKGSADAAFRADLKSKVSQATKKAGEFQIQKRSGDMLTGNIARAKKGKLDA
jgi:hypothetical protein